MRVLGISAYYHDAAAALVEDGVIVAAAQEERFSRIKHDSSLPRQAMAYCLRAGGVRPGELDAVVYYEKPLLTLLRIFRSRFAAAPRGFAAFYRAIGGWGRHKLWIAYEIERELVRLGHRRPPRVWFSEHHVSHAASAFFPSPFERAAVITFDGVGEFATTSVAVGEGNELRLLEEIDFPDSIGLLYSTFTGYCGFRVNSGEYKLMGLAPYGRPRYVDTIYEHLVDVADDGAFHLDRRYFDFIAGARMFNERFCGLFGGPSRGADEPLEQRHADIARSIQEVTEELTLGIARHAAELTGMEDLCLAGGVALNCVANARLRRDGPFERIWVQPAAGDAGGAIGAAMHGYHQIAGRPRHTDGVRDAMQGALLGPAFDHDEVGAWLAGCGYPARRLGEDERADAIADLLAGGAVVAVVQGRMEFGPRALGNRSILADPRAPSMQRTLNQRIKKRESFRPFAPAVLAERADEWFELQDIPSPYMLFTAAVRDGHRSHADACDPPLLASALDHVASDIPAVTHVDGSARVQTVSRESNPAFWAILAAFERRTGCPVLVNTSFNVRGEPVVCTPEDAYRSFLWTDVDHLVLGSWLLTRSEQPDAGEAARAPAHLAD